MKLNWIVLVAASFFPVASVSEVFQSSVDPAQLHEVKKTPQMQYLTSVEAYALVTADPDIFFIDVRDPLEIMLSGHPLQVDAIVPMRIQSTVFDEELKEWALEDNPDFLMHMDAALEDFGKAKNDMIIITCGSGRRSALAARKLHKAGYTNVWHITDGYEGEEKRGLNTANAWKIAGLPWSYSRIHGSQPLRIIE